jgi:alkyl sulfatase BDS1-like metallo-beta-lactamase superfamily hydrolase
VYVIHNFMTPEEAQHLMDLAKPKLARATVVGWVLTSAQLSHLGGVARCSSPT